jgi:ABC-type arginine transport system permease subunit
LIYALARRISPVDAEEWVAGVALGLNPAQVMREIVVPANRPGLLLFLNRARQVFH